MEPVRFFQQSSRRKWPPTHVSDKAVYRVSHRKWRETKHQHPSRARSGHQISCWLVSLHLLCDILTGRPVYFLLLPPKVIISVSQSHSLLFVRWRQIAYLARCRNYLASETNDGIRAELYHRNQALRINGTIVAGNPFIDCFYSTEGKIKVCLFC